MIEFFVWALLGKIVFAFCAMVLLDFVWARYNVACAEIRIMPASIYASAIMLLGGIVVLTYVDDHWMMLPAGAGAFCGTFLSLWLEKRSKAKKATAGKSIIT